MRPETKLRTYVVRPDHMAEFAKVAASQNLSVSGLLRLVVLNYLTREARRNRAAKKK